MKQRILLLALALIVLALVGCAPFIVVENKTSFPVRAVVITPQGSSTVSPSPGESSTVEGAEGKYTVTVIPDAEWIEYAKTVRKLLNEQLATSDQMTGAQLLDVIRRLKEIALRMQQYEQAAGSQARCVGNITQDNGGGVTVISVAPNSSLVVSCR